MLECVLSTQKNNYLYHNGERFCLLFESGSECSLFNALDVDKVSSKLEGPRFSKTITSYGLGSAGCTQYQTSVSSGSDKLNQNHELNKYCILCCPRHPVKDPIVVDREIVRIFLI